MEPTEQADADVPLTWKKLLIAAAVLLAVFAALGAFAAVAADDPTSFYVAMAAGVATTAFIVWRARPTT